MINLHPTKFFMKSLSEFHPFTLGFGVCLFADVFAPVFGGLIGILHYEHVSVPDRAVECRGEFGFYSITFPPINITSPDSVENLSTSDLASSNKLISICNSSAHTG